MFQENPITKIAFILVTLLLLAGAYTLKIDYFEEITFVWLFAFFGMLLRSKLNADILKSLAEALKEKWSRR